MFEPVLTEGGSNIILQMISRDDNAEKRFLHLRGMMNCFVSGTEIRIWRE